MRAFRCVHSEVAGFCCSQSAAGRVLPLKACCMHLPSHRGAWLVHRCPHGMWRLHPALMHSWHLAPAPCTALVPAGQGSAEPLDLFMQAHKRGLGHGRHKHHHADGSAGGGDGKRRKRRGGEKARRAAHRQARMAEKQGQRDRAHQVWPCMLVLPLVLCTSTASCAMVPFEGVSGRWPAHMPVLPHCPQPRCGST